MRRSFGTVYYFLTLNVFHQRLFGRVYRTKHSVNWLEYLKDARAEYPADQRVHLIWDGASNHWTKEIRQWARENRVRLYSTPTHASHLNPVECHAGDLRSWRWPGTDVHEPGDRGSRAGRGGRVSERGAEGAREAVPRHGAQGPPTQGEEPELAPTPIGSSFFRGRATS